MAGAIYSLCAIAAIVCAWLLLRSYPRGRYRLLLWSGLCFVGLALNNILLVIDELMLPEMDLAIWRTMAALVSMLILLYGLIWDAEQ